jgi:hypothetical protein
MTSVKIIIPGRGGIIEARKARLAAAVQWQWNVVTAPPEKKIRPPSAGDLVRRPQTARLA